MRHQSIMSVFIKILVVDAYTYYSYSKFEYNWVEGCENNEEDEASKNIPEPILHC